MQSHQGSQFPKLRVTGSNPVGVAKYPIDLKRYTAVRPLGSPPGRHEGAFSAMSEDGLDYCQWRCFH